MSARTLTIGGELQVMRLGFGAMRITGPGGWGPPADVDKIKLVLKRTLELGVNFIDTADSYGPNVSEELIAHALYPYPEGLVIATKGGYVRTGYRQTHPDCRPESLRRACEGSLARLRVDSIDLYQLHTVDPDVPIEESLGALSDLQAEGKIRFIGISNVSIDDLNAAERVAEIVSVQNEYNEQMDRGEDVLEACEARGMIFIPYFPLQAGKASSPVDALTWLLRRSPVMLPIPGTSLVAHLEENMRAVELA